MVGVKAKGKGVAKGGKAKSAKCSKVSKSGGRVLADGTNYAKFASAAYAKKGTTPRVISPGYKLVRKWPKVSVYVNHGKREVVFAVRGTKPSSVGDIITDIGIVGGIDKLTPEYAVAVLRFKKLKKKYPGYKFVTTGHSKGGRLALNLGWDFPKTVKKVFTFAAGSSIPHQALYKKNKKYHRYINTKTENERVKKDPISLLVENPVNIQGKPGVHPHLMSNFLPNEDTQPAPAKSNRRRR